MWAKGRYWYVPCSRQSCAQTKIWLLPSWGTKTRPGSSFLWDILVWCSEVPYCKEQKIASMDRNLCHLPTMCCPKATNTKGQLPLARRVCPGLCRTIQTWYRREQRTLILWFQALHHIHSQWPVLRLWPTDLPRQQLSARTKDRYFCYICRHGTRPAPSAPVVYMNEITYMIMK